MARLECMTRALAHDLSPGGITFNCISPGMVETVRGGSDFNVPDDPLGLQNLAAQWLGA